MRNQRELVLRAMVARHFDCNWVFRGVLVRSKESKPGRIGTFLHDGSGSALVEFALSSVVVILILFGIIQCCFALYTYDYVSDAARIATRYAVVRGSGCTGMPDCGITGAQIQTYLRSVPYPGINPQNLNASVTWLSISSGQPATWTACAGQCNTPENSVQVQVTYSFPLNIPFWSNRTLTLRSASQMVISN